MKKLLPLLSVLFLISWGCDKKNVIPVPVINFNKSNLYDELLKMDGSFVWMDFSNRYLKYKIKFEKDYKFSKYINLPLHLTPTDYRWKLLLNGSVEVFESEDKNLIGVTLVGEENSISKYTVGVKTDSGYRPHYYIKVTNPDYEITETKLDSINELKGFEKNEGELYQFLSNNLDEFLIKNSFTYNSLFNNYHYEDIILDSLFIDSLSIYKKFYIDKYYKKLINGNVYGFYGEDKTRLKKLYLGKIIKGHKDGKWITYSENGIKKTEKNYKNGELVNGSDG